MNSAIDRPPLIHTLDQISAVLHPRATALNKRLLDAFLSLSDEDYSRRTHYIGERFENLYLEPEQLGGMQELAAFVKTQAATLLERPEDELRLGFWLNAMGPGQYTSEHHHDENDELLSAVYYVSAPPDSGSLTFRWGPVEGQIQPKEGMLLLFPPDLPHAVTKNQSEQVRLSIAFNIGPNDPDAG